MVLGKAGLVVLAIGLSVLSVKGLENTPQPIGYSHKKHVEDAGLVCADCHRNVETKERASIPNIDVCGDCHDDTEVENPEEVRVAGYVTRAERIPWRQVHLVPDYAYFSHRRHVKLGQLECSLCHGDVARMEDPFLGPYRPIVMKWCTDCHEERAVTNDCYACHR
ncbi:MAG: cytochrome c3 family protein [Acidobacteriota bacterium]